QAEKYNMDVIMYDPTKAFRLNKSLQEKGYNTEVVRQGFKTLGPALDDLKEMFLDGTVIYNNNPLLRWYINNVELVKDRNNNRMPTKASRYRKIDGFAALLNAHVRVMEMLVVPSSEGNIEVMSMADLIK